MYIYTILVINENIFMNSHRIQSIISSNNRLEDQKYKKRNKISIMHVQQIHKPRFCKEEDIPKEIEEVAYSQYHVAKVILENKDAIVLKESLIQDLSPVEFKQASSNIMLVPSFMKHIFPSGIPSAFTDLTPFQETKQLSSDTISISLFMKRTFPSGIPSAFTDLTPFQKVTLLEFGGTFVLFYLGLLTHVYKTISKDENCYLDARIATGELHLMMEPRERLAIHWAKQAALKSDKNKILLIYGVVHDFEHLISKLNDPKVVFSKKFLTSMPTIPDLAPSAHNEDKNEGSISAPSLPAADNSMKDRTISFK